MAMKRLSYLAVAGLLLSLAAAASARGAGDRLAQWTIMVYMDADNNLGKEAWEDVGEMEMIPYHPDINVVIQLDRRDGITGWTTARRYLIQEDPDTTTLAYPFEEELGEVDMGDPDVLYGFVAWAHTYYPAGQYCLILWNHGNGWRDESALCCGGRGVGDDHSADGDYISICDGELQEALEPFAPMEIIAFDACLMGMVEVAHACAGLADFMVAAEPSIPGSGYPYADVLGELWEAGGLMMPEELASMIVAKFCPSYPATESVQLAAMRLSGTSDVLSALDSFSTSLENAIDDGHRDDIRAVRATTQTYEYFCYNPPGVMDERPVYIDLRTFAAKITDEPWASAALIGSATELAGSIDAMVIAQCIGGSDYPGSSGLSIYYPDAVTCCYELKYDTCRFSAASQWDDYLRRMTPTSGKTDLQVADVTSTDYEPVVNENILVLVEVKNVGSEPSVPTQLEYFRHLEGPPGGGQAGDVVWEVPVLQPGETRIYMSPALTSPIPTTWDSYACIDRDDDNDELCEINYYGPLEIHWLPVSPVEAGLWAAESENGGVTVGWTAPSLCGVSGFNVYRATDQAGPFIRLNRVPIPPVLPGQYHDATVWPGATFWYRVAALTQSAPEEDIVDLPVSVTTTGRLVTRLHAARPNPFATATSLTFDVPSHSAGAVRIGVYDLQGRLVKVLVDHPLEGGRYTAYWDGTNEHGSRVASGVYFARLEAGEDQKSRKLIVLK